MRELVTKLVIITSQGYIFRILQHFATKLCSFSNFDNFFPEISFVIPTLKIFLKRKSSIQFQFSVKDCSIILHAVLGNQFACFTAVIREFKI